MTEVSKSTQRLKEVLKQTNETPQLAIEKTQSATFSQPSVENTHNHSHAKVKFEPSLEHTSTTMKTANNFVKTEERPNGDTLWNGIPIESLGGPTFQTYEDEYDKSTDLQNAFIDTAEKSVKKLNYMDKVKNQIILTFVNCRITNLQAEKPN